MIEELTQDLASRKNDLENKTNCFVSMCCWESSVFRDSLFMRGRLTNMNPAHSRKNKSLPYEWSNSGTGFLEGG